MISPMRRKKSVTTKQSRYTARYPMASAHFTLTAGALTPRLLETEENVFPTMPVLSSQKGTLASHDSTPGASIRHDTSRVTRRMEAYMSFDMVELWQEPKTEQTALQAAVPAQHARLLMLRIPPILGSLFTTFLVVLIWFLEDCLLCEFNDVALGEFYPCFL